MTALALAWAALLVAWLRSCRPPIVRGAPSPTTSVPRPTAWPGIGELSAHRRSARERRAIEAGIPDVIDLYAVGVAAGLNVRLATLAVASRAPPGPLRTVLAEVDGALASGARLGEILERMPSRLGSGGTATRPLFAALLDAERYGTALGPTLDRLADDARRRRQRRAEESARRLPVKLLFPLVTCILPAFGLLTVAPLIAGGLRALRL